MVWGMVIGGTGGPIMSSDGAGGRSERSQGVWTPDIRGLWTGRHALITSDNVVGQGGRDMGAWVRVGVGDRGETWVVVGEGGGGGPKNEMTHMTSFNGVAG